MDIAIVVLVYVAVLGAFLFRTWLSILNYQNRNAKIPEEVSDVYNKEKYIEWSKYNMENYKFSIIVRTLNLFVFLVLLVFGIFPLLDKLSNYITSNQDLQILLFMGFYFLILFVIGVITSYYQTFKIEEKFGFNRTTKKTFILDKFKSFMLTIVFGGGLLYLLISLNNNAGRMFYIYAWLSLVFIFLIVNILYTGVIVPLFNKLVPLEDGDLKEDIQSFAKTVGYEVTKISVMDASRRSSKLNAYFSGFGRFKKIVLYDTLIHKMSTQEIVAVLAHEIGHNKHKHIIFNMIQTSITLLLYVGLLGLLLNQPIFSTAFGFDSANFGFAIILFIILVDPIDILMGLFLSKISRTFEYQADAFAAEHYSKNDMINALKIITRENFSNLTPHPLYVKFLYTHPPVANRIKAINKLNKQKEDPIYD